MDIYSLLSLLPEPLANERQIHYQRHVCCWEETNNVRTKEWQSGTAVFAALGITTKRSRPLVMADSSLCSSQRSMTFQEVGSITAS